MFLLNKFITINSEDPDCFTAWFQRHGKSEEIKLTIRQLQQANANSQKFFDTELIPFKQSNVDKLSKEIFITDGWMFQDPKVAAEAVTEKLYLIGGRHRLFAITDVLGKIGSYTGIGEQIFNQLIRVEVLTGVEVDEIPPLILADNGSRRVTPAERIGIMTRRYKQGTDERDYIELALAPNLIPSHAKQAAASYFAKKAKATGLMTEIKGGAVGKQLGKYLLYGDAQFISRKTPKLIKSVDEFVEKAERLWKCVELVARQDNRLIAGETASKAVQMYEREMNP